MKKFVTTTFLYFLAVLIIIAGLYVWFYLSKKDEVVKIPKANIIIGDSNTRWSVNDSILSGYSNYSVGGETYLFAYTKLKILDKANKIDTMMLAFSPHNIINNMWWNDEETQPIQGRMPAFYTDFTLEDHKILMRSLPKNYLKSLFKIGKEELSPLFNVYKTDRMHRFGFYMPTKQNETQYTPKFYPFRKAVETEQEIIYLDKIIAECKKRNIHLILINTPKNYLRADYKNYCHPKFYEIYYRKYPHIDFLDFSKLQLPKHAYWDVSHVDIVGAEYFSNFMQKEGIRNLLNSKYNLKK